MDVKPPDPDELNKIGQLWQWAMAGVSAVVAWIAHNTMNRIKALEENKVDKTTYKDDKDRTETSRRELREAQINLFKGQEEIGKTLARIEGKIDARGAK